MRGAQVRCPSLTKSRLDRLKRAHAFWRLDRLARSLRNILPGIALIVGDRSPCAGGAGAGGAIVDHRSGQWTRLQLMEMDAAFCLRMRRAHPERQIGMAAHLILR